MNLTNAMHEASVAAMEAVTMPTSEDVEIYTRLFARDVITMESLQHDLESDIGDFDLMWALHAHPSRSPSKRHEHRALIGLSLDELAEVRR